MRVLNRHLIYRNCEPETLSDHIALDQFLLALERNLLLHIATGLNMTVVGLAMFRFFSRHQNDLYAGIGLVAFLVAILIAAKGIVDYVRMKKILSMEEKEG
jgi:putative membrane protein